LTELTKRIIVAVIGIPATILIIYVGGYLIFGAIILFSNLTLLEFYKLIEAKGAKPNKSLAVIGMSILQFSLFYFLFYVRWEGLLKQYLLIEIFIFLMISLVVELFRSKENVIINFSATVAGFIYVSLSFMSLIAIRHLYKIRGEEFSEISSCWLLLSVFFSIWICDTAAYFTGKAIGKHKLFPRVSPNKSWEGAIAGLLGGIGGFLLFAYLLIPEISVVDSFALGTIVGIIGQIGDLAESHLKRDAGVKDSSSILPGHGGFLDRFDSIMFVFPSVLFYIIIFF
jgi:phosphatidate cytidylyltransferase